MTTYEGHICNSTWTIYSEDCLRALGTIQDSSIDCILTSPPYADSRAYGESGRQEGNLGNYKVALNGTPMKNEIGYGQKPEEFYESLEELFSICYRILKEKKCFFINVGKIRKNLETIDISHEIIKRAKKQGFKHRDTIIWFKANPRPSLKTAQPYYLDDGWEYLLLFTKGKAILNREEYITDNIKFNCVTCNTTNELRKKTKPNYFTTNIGFAEKGLKSNHPAKFPMALPEFVFSISTKKGDTILDPFAGVGTSLVVGLKKELNVIGCEINNKYCEAIIQEINKIKNIKESENLSPKDCSQDR